MHGHIPFLVCFELGFMALIKVMVKYLIWSFRLSYLQIESMKDKLTVFFMVFCIARDL